LRRTCTIKLVVDEETEKRLRRLCELSSKLWNEINYARLKAWMEKKGIDFEATYREFYEKYKPLIGAATTQMILLKNGKAWKNFFRLLELKKQGRLPPFITRVSPPGYKRKSRVLWTIIRKDQYEMDGDRIIIKWLGAVSRIEMRFKGPVYLRGERGELILIIRYDDDRKRWHAHIAFSKVSERMVRGEWRPAPRRPKGNLTAGVDVGVNNLLAIYVENGLTKLVNGRPLKAISHYWRKKIAKYQSTLNKYGLEMSRRLRRMYMKWKRQIRHYIDTKVRGAVEWLYDVGVSMIKVGYPRHIAQGNGNFNNVHVWSYGYLLRRIAEVAEEHGISVIYVDEAGTLTRCQLHGDGCGIRVHRWLFKCTTMNKVFNADLIAARNILMTATSNNTSTTPITPESRRGIGGNGRRPGQRLNPQKGGCSPNLPILYGEGVVVLLIKLLSQAFNTSSYLRFVCHTLLATKISSRANSLMASPTSSSA